MAYVVAGMLVLVLAGCGSISSTSTAPAFTREGECQRNGGYWRASMNYCEYQR